jgi:hypothetical protein
VTCCFRGWFGQVKELEGKTAESVERFESVRGAVVIISMIIIIIIIIVVVVVIISSSSSLSYHHTTTAIAIATALIATLHAP